ncbi:MAG: hypothetical protein C4517_12745 [Stygiobacter sp.]|nr:MAG: hypothetical protein C4517_12745 [Stygiobacter sp.]
MMFDEDQILPIKVSGLAVNTSHKYSGPENSLHAYLPTSATLDFSHSTTTRFSSATVVFGPSQPPTLNGISDIKLATQKIDLSSIPNYTAIPIQQNSVCLEKPLVGYRSLEIFEGTNSVHLVDTRAYSASRIDYGNKFSNNYKVNEDYCIPITNHSLSVLAINNSSTININNVIDFRKSINEQAKQFTTNHKFVNYDNCLPIVIDSNSLFKEIKTSINKTAKGLLGKNEVDFSEYIEVLSQYLPSYSYFDYLHSAEFLVTRIVNSLRAIYLAYTSRRFFSNSLNVAVAILLHNHEIKQNTFFQNYFLIISHKGFYSSLYLHDQVISTTYNYYLLLKNYENDHEEHISS